MIKAIIFDLDGTLANTLDTLAYYCNRVLTKRSLAPIETDAYRYLVGNGAQNLMEQMLIRQGITPENAVVDAMLQDFNQMYLSDTMYLTKPYEGIPELLNVLKARGLKLAVFSNKPDPATQKVVQSLFTQDIFTFVLGKKEELPRKPAPDGALFAAKELGVQPSECLYVGDTDTDMQTGRAAGMLTTGVLWGFRDEAELRQNHADFIAARPEQLVQILDNMNPAQ